MRIEHPRDYYHYDSPKRDGDLIEWDGTPADFEIHAGVVVQHRLENTEHITGRFIDADETR